MPFKVSFRASAAQRLRPSWMRISLRSSRLCQVSLLSAKTIFHKCLHFRATRSCANWANMRTNLAKCRPYRRWPRNHGRSWRNRALQLRIRWRVWWSYRCVLFVRFFLITFVCLCICTTPCNHFPLILSFYVYSQFYGISTLNDLWSFCMHIVRKNQTLLRNLCKTHSLALNIHSYCGCKDIKSASLCLQHFANRRLSQLYSGVEP